MEKETDDKVAIEIIADSVFDFNIYSGSFDKGYYSPENKSALEGIIPLLVMPKKGKLSALEMEEETSDVFKHLRNKHAAVESAVNCLEHHGLDRCPDHGIDGFKRYVSLSVLSRNIDRIGSILKNKKISEHYKKAS